MYHPFVKPPTRDNLRQNGWGGLRNAHLADRGGDGGSITGNSWFVTTIHRKRFRGHPEEP